MSPNYLKEYLRSNEHLWTAVTTLGAGLAAGSVVGLCVGVAAYALAWIYVPDMPFFRNRIDAKAAVLSRQEAEAQAQAFRDRRDRIRKALRPDNQARYNELAAVCREVEGGENSSEVVMGRLDELMWTFLKLLTLQEAMQRFLAESKSENLESQIKEAQAELDKLLADPPAPGSTREKLLNSKQQVVEVLKKRQEAITNASDNLGIVQSEQERLGHQIRLLRAEAVASRNSDMLTAKIDASVQTLELTNSMLSQMGDYREIIADMPPIGARIGYGEKI